MTVRRRAASRTAALDRTRARVVFSAPVSVSTRRRAALLARVVPALLVLAAASTARAAPPASPLLPPDDPSVLAAGRLERLGLAPGFQPAQRAVPVRAVAAAFAEAEARAASERPELVAEVRALRARFLAAWPGLAPEEDGGPHALGAGIALGAEGGRAREVAAGPPSAGPAALHLQAPGDDPYAEAGGAAALGPLAAGGLLHARPDGARVAALELTGGLGPVALSIGRGPLGYGVAELGTPVLSGAVALDRVELSTAAPLVLPWGLGTLALDGALARLDDDRPEGPVLLLASQLLWRPHPRFTVELARAFMFGGRLWDGISVADAVQALSGLGNKMGNNVMSAGLRWRLPTDAWQPVTAVLDLGTDDNPSAALAWPGLAAGLSAPRLAGLPLEATAEVAWYGHGLTIFTHDPFPWYTHGQYVGGWRAGGAPLGDSLAGNGKAARLRLVADPLGPLFVRLDAWAAQRAGDDLYAPQAGGASGGAALQAELRRGRFTAGAAASHERGDAGWRRTVARGYLGVSL